MGGTETNDIQIPFISNSIYILPLSICHLAGSGCRTGLSVATAETGKKQHKVMVGLALVLTESITFGKGLFILNVKCHFKC